MNKIQFTKSEVLAYLEEKIIDEAAIKEEHELYEDYKWFNKFDKTSYSYKKVLSRMHKEYRGE